MYASDAEGHDLMLIGKLVAAVESGKEAEISFTARIVTERTIVGFRIKLYEVWSVSYDIRSSLVSDLKSDG